MTVSKRRCSALEMILIPLMVESVDVLCVLPMSLSQPSGAGGEASAEIPEGIKDNKYWIEQRQLALIGCR